ncbi:histidine phosphatase family protein [Sporosarcina jiandibaonis]|uniref:histidine phosphatase family protein n=1 Tax=Sporosarcina jiandibaonis TaxID=2715535 RepID=UPI001FE5D1E0|nr:histidine phosphatase family protein [Sporosarcina jiandibaonis]
MTSIYMIRHAESPFIFGEERTRKLSKDGEIEAGKVAKIMLSEKIDAIVSSPFARSIQTIEEIATTQNLEIKLYEELRERMIKGNYSLPWEEVEPAIKRSFEDKDYCLSGGETTRQAQERAVPIIKQLLKEYEGKSIVLGTHGNIMTIIMNYFDGKYGYDFWASTSKPDIYKLVFSDGKLIEVKRIWENEDAA